MKTKLTIIAIFTLIILSLVLVEVTYVKTSLLDISEQSKQIIEQIKQENSNEEIISSLNATYDYWKKHEYNFCFLYNLYQRKCHVCTLLLQTWHLCYNIDVAKT